MGIPEYGSVPAPLLSLRDAAKRLGLSIWTLRAWAERGRIATVKLGSRVLVRDAEIQRVIAEGTRPARSQQPRGGQ